MAKNKLCPVCGTEGLDVGINTVKSMVTTKLVFDGTFYLCVDEDCKVAYYNPETLIVVTLEEVKVPIWLKKNANPKYICYCNKVTVVDIISAIKDRNAKNMKDIIKITGAMRNGNCEENHPTGKCCSQVIQEVIEENISCS